MTNDFLKWVEKNPIQVVAVLIFACVLVVSVTSCASTAIQSEFKFKTERERLIHE